jgi:hypothetical protein
MKKKPLKKLNLNLTTVANLTATELDHVLGGIGGDDGGGGEVGLEAGPAHKQPSCRQSWAA